MAQSASGRAGFQAHHVGYDEAEHHPYLNGERIAASQELGGQEMTDTSRETLIPLINGIAEQFPMTASYFRALLDKCDAANARAEKAERSFRSEDYRKEGYETIEWGDEVEHKRFSVTIPKTIFDSLQKTALEAARIEGCRMGLMRAKNIAVDSICKNNDAADQIADKIYALDPALIVKEHEK